MAAAPELQTGAVDLQFLDISAATSHRNFKSETAVD
jgi:hypothetical protein